MTAHDAVNKRTDITALQKDIKTLCNILNADSAMRHSLSEAVGVLDIADRLSYATDLLEEYDTMLSKALRSTVLKEVEL